MNPPNHHAHAPPDEKGESASFGLFLLAPTLIVLLAAAFRFVALGQVPPGLHLDEAIDGLDALRVLDGIRPVFFAGNQGREPLAIYLEALSMALLGPSPLALRLPSAALGILTVATCFTTFRAFAGRSVGLLGSALLAVSYWHVSLSRLVFRAVDLPLFSTLAVFWLWKGLRSGRARHYALAGVFLGIDLYTYIPARLAPLLFFGWIAGCALVSSWRHPSFRRLLRGGFVALALFAATVAPLAIYAADHPNAFTQRLHSAAGPDARLSSILVDLGQSAEALVWKGDSNPRHNLPGRPLVDFPLVLAGVLGLVLAARRWREGWFGFALVWCLAMLAPAALSDDPFHALRLVGELPFILLFPALGLDWFARRRWFGVRAQDEPSGDGWLILGRSSQVS